MKNNSLLNTHSLRSQAGATAVEYVVIALLLALALIPTLREFKSHGEQTAVALNSIVTGDADNSLRGDGNYNFNGGGTTGASNAPCTSSNGTSLVDNSQNLQTCADGHVTNASQQGAL